MNNSGNSPNRLAQEQSPYLLQHQHNPVDWYPWGEEAFSLARTKERPIFLSIGYSTCHWCHVMEQESFENHAIAELLNRNFVAIKVDREERPDIDRVYMTAVQVLTGAGGWPLSAFLTPELEPFYAGTYFPPETHHGQPGFKQLLQEIQKAWQQDRNRISDSAGKITLALRSVANNKAPDHSVAAEPQNRAEAIRHLQRDFDAQNGGFGRAPKFPRPAVLDFLLLAGRGILDRCPLETEPSDPQNTNQPQSSPTHMPSPTQMVADTLRQMWNGGIYDHLGGGFHRYSVDPYWRVPHFEKMLYDQAQLLHTTIDALRCGLGRESPTFERLAGSLISYLLRDLNHPAGGFYSAEDADSAPDPTRPQERIEGAFYLWTVEEVNSLLGEDAADFCKRWGLESGGNTLSDPHHEFGAGNVLYRTQVQPKDEGSDRRLRDRLLDQRSRRCRPRLDDKVICSWNGLTISALCHAALLLDRPSWLTAAQRATRYLIDHLSFDDQTGRRLHRCARLDQASSPAQLDDYANLATALLDLHASDGNSEWLDLSQQLTQSMIDVFWDADNGAFFDGPNDDSVLVRTQDGYDGAEPSGNSIAGLLLLRLARTLTAHPEVGQWEDAARSIVARFSASVQQAPTAAPRLLILAALLEQPPQQVVVRGTISDPLTRALLRAIANAPPRPDRGILVIDPDSANQSEVSSYPEGMLPDGTPVLPGSHGPPSAWVCRDLHCELPTASPERVTTLLS